MIVFQPFSTNTGRAEQLCATLFFILLFIICFVFSLGVNANTSSETVSPSIKLTTEVIEGSKRLNLTDDEQRWIKRHPLIPIGVDGNWPPIDFIGENKIHQGITADYLKVIGQRLGVEFDPITGPTFKEMLNKLVDGELQAGATISYKKDRARYLHFTKPFFMVKKVIVGRENGSHIQSLEDLNGKTVAIEDGFFTMQQLQELYPQIQLMPVTSTLEALKAVSWGHADAYVGNQAVSQWLMRQEQLTNLRFIADPSLGDGPQNFAISKAAPEWEPLVGILDKALANITMEERLAIEQRWLGVPRPQTQMAEFVLTNEEQRWLRDHPKIRVAVMNSWPPFNFVDKDGKAKGIGVDYISALNKRLNGMLQIVPGPWKQIYEDVEKKQLDALMDVTPKPSREPFFNFTSPYLDVPHVIVARKDSPYLNSEEDLAGKTIALEQGFGNVLYFQEKYPEVKIKQYQNTSTALDAVARGEADAYAGNRAVATYLMEKEVMVNLMVHGRMKKPGSILAIGTRKDWPVLRDILQKAMDNISHNEKQAILRKWIEVEEKKVTYKLRLSAEEKFWLDGHKKIRLGVDAAWPPVEWIDEAGRHRGMTSEYFALIGDMLAIESEPVQGLSWSEIMKGAEQGEIDVIPALVSSEERRKYLNFTSPYLSFPLVIFTRDGASLVTTLTDLYGKRVAVEEGYISYEYLQRDYPRINLTTYKTTEEILRALSLGQVDAYVGNLTVAGYLINKTGFTNIKVAAPTPYSYELSIGVRKDWPELIPVLDRALSMIDEEQRNTIRQKWLKLHYEIGVDYTLVKKTIFAAVFLILIILGWMIFIQRQKRMLREAKAETDRINEAYHVANDQLSLANTKLKELDQMKSMFIASISHELRTPLNSIIGFSSMMVDGSFGKLNEKYQDYSTRINNSGQHLLALITDIIDISKIEAGRVDIVQGDFELADVVSEAVEELGQQIKDKGLSFEVNVSQNVAMHTDKRRLFQCLLNMLSNAMKYTEQGGITLTAEEQEDEVLLTICDSGIGISETDLPRLFEAFERMKSHLQVKAGGTGLGLYLTRKIVTDLLQGEVGVESKLGEGSCFWIRVPKTIDTKAITISEEEV